MDIHKNARLTVHGRERIVRQVMSGQTPQAVALAAGVCPRTIRKWLSRYRAEGLPKDRAVAAPTLDGQADCDRGRRLAGHRQPRFASSELEQAEHSGAAARPPLREGKAG